MRKDHTKWFLVLLGFIALGLAFSSRAFLSLSMIEWENEFGWTKSMISGVSAIGLIFMAIIAPVVGFSVDRFGARPVLTTGLIATGVGSLLVATMQDQTMFIISYSVISALGFGIVSMHVVVTSIAPFFDRNRGLATGIASGGATGGQLLFVPLFSILLSWYGWRTGYIAMSAVTLFTALIYWVAFKTLRPTAGHLADKADTTNITLQLAKLLKNKVFHALFWSFTLCGFTTAGVIETHFLPYASICGFSPTTSATAFGVLSSFNLFGMILAGYLSDRMNNVILLFGIYLSRALSFILLLYIGLDVKLLFTFSVIFGLFDYSTVPVTANLVAKHLGLQSMGLIMGVLAMGHALGAASGAWIGGITYDISASYVNIWLSSVALAMLSAVFILIIPQMPKLKEKMA